MIDFTIVAPTGMFKTFRAQFGMDNEGNYRQQSLTNMQKAVYNGKMSVVDYYERQVQTVYNDRIFQHILCNSPLSFLKRAGKKYSSNGDNHLVLGLICT